MGKVLVVGIGPGDYEGMTIRAAQALRTCDVIVGYTVYVELVREHFPDREFRSTPMTRETERCRIAFEEAARGKTAAMICSGDPGIYGMSGLILAVGAEYPGIPVEVIPGVTAASSGAALLGAPLIHDFAVVSLSDRLTPWEKIEKRLRLAAEADLVLCLYNPASKKRADYLARACDILLEILPPDRICGIARQIGRTGEETSVLPLRGLRDFPADMFTTVFIGNSQTEERGGHMVTPRGYVL